MFKNMKICKKHGSFYYIIIIFQDFIRLWLAAILKFSVLNEKGLVFIGSTHKTTATIVLTRIYLILYYIEINCDVHILFYRQIWLHELASTLIYMDKEVLGFDLATDKTLN